MRSLIFIFLIAGSCLHAQTFAIKADFAYGSSRLWKIKGEAPNSHFTYESRWAPSVGVEYQFLSGVILTGNVSYQKDRFSMVEDPFEYQSVLAFQKTYTSVALNIGGGYSHALGSTNFSVFGLATVGAGLVRSEQETNSFDMEGITYVTTPEGSFMDSVQIHYSLTDHAVNTVKLRFECAAGLEYQWKRLFCRGYAGLQVWANPFSEVQYDASHYSQHYSMSRTSNGDFNIKPGYLFYGVGLGWKFGV